MSQNKVNPVSFIEGNSTSFLKRSYSTAFEADSSVSDFQLDTTSKIVRYDGLDSSGILYEPTSLGINSNGPLDRLLQPYTHVITGISGLDLDQSSSDYWKKMIENDVSNMYIPEHSDNQTEVTVTISEPLEPATTSTSIPTEQLLEQIKEISNKVSSIQEVQLKLTRIVHNLCSPERLRITSQNVSIPNETKDSSIPSSNNLVGAKEHPSYSFSSQNVCTPENVVATMKTVVETQAPVDTEEPSMKYSLSRNIPLIDVSVEAYPEFESPLSSLPSRESSPEIVEIPKPEAEFKISKGNLKAILNETPSNLQDKGKGKAIVSNETPSNLLDKGKGRAQIDWNEAPGLGLSVNRDPDIDTVKSYKPSNKNPYWYRTINPMSCSNKDIVFMRNIYDSCLHRFRLTDVYDSIIQDSKLKINYQYDDSSPSFFQELFKIYQDNWVYPIKDQMKKDLVTLSAKVYSVDFNNEIFINQGRGLGDIPYSGVRSIFNIRHHLLTPIFYNNYYSMLLLFNPNDILGGIRFEHTYNYTIRLSKDEIEKLGFYLLELPGLSFGGIDQYLSHMSVSLRNQVQSVNASANTFNTSVPQANRLLSLIDYYRFVLNKAYTLLENWAVARGTVNMRIDLHSILFLDKKTSKTLRLKTAGNILQEFLDLSSTVYGELKKISLENYNKLFLCYTTNCIVRIDGNGEVKTIGLNSLDKLEKFITMYPHINLFPEGLAVKHNFSSMSWEEFCVRQAFPDSLVDLMKERIKLVIEKRLFPEKSDNKVPVRKTFIEIRDINTIGLRVTANG